jgi:ABC-2 type transport system ATP-binding protein
MSFIEVKNVSKDFKISKRDKGFRNSVKALFHPEYQIKKAVNNVSFDIDKGELVGYIGPNGAGKSTTIKMLSGILLPTSGTVTVDGRFPYENRQDNAMRIGVVFGQRSQLFWDLPMEETFDLYRKMYRVEETRFKRNVDFYVELLGMQDFLRTPVRQLSLGQKMRANISLALLHDPDIVYLDEPTIGLDVVAKDRIRHFVKEINKEKDTTIILTTHDMDDIEQICKRLIMIDMGQVIYDGLLDDFKQKYSGGNTIIAEFAEGDARIPDNRFRIIREEGPKKWITFEKDEISIA